MIEVLSQISDLSGLAVINHEAKAVTLVSSALLHAPGNPFTIRRIERCGVTAWACTDLFRCAAGSWDHKDVIIRTDRFHLDVVAGERYFRSVGRNGIEPRSAHKEC